MRQMLFSVTRSFVLRLAVAALLMTAPVHAAERSGADHFIAAYYPPLMIDGETEMPGSSIEILREAARRLGRSNTIEFLPFRRALKTLRHRDDALQPALYRLPGREKDYRWIAHTHDVYDAFHTVGAPIDNLEAARKLDRIGVETDASMDVFLTKIGFTNIERVDSPTTNAQKLRAGRIDAWALTHSLAVWTWKKAGIDQPLTSGTAIRTAPVYVVAGLNYPPDRVAAYRATLRGMKADGSIRAILERYR
ncbi:MAG: transporter substrate-binding domain-containing protein [Alphaproteobacteria bacterium]|nr:transporter substrate-binding domain-containing protein [Alphaproteobacteria bacterium]